MSFQPVDEFGYRNAVLQENLLHSRLFHRILDGFQQFSGILTLYQLLVLLQCLI